MTDERKPASDSEIEQEIREGRRFSMNEAMARMAGPGAMAGASPVSEVLQAETEIGSWLGAHLPDACGALRVVVHRHLKGSSALLDTLDRPLDAVAAFCRHVLASEPLLKELVREADVEWGRAMGERPHFDRDGVPPGADDPYTAQSVGDSLRSALGTLERER